VWTISRWTAPFGLCSYQQSLTNTQQRKKDPMSRQCPPIFRTSFWKQRCLKPCVQVTSLMANSLWTILYPSKEPVSWGHDAFCGWWILEFAVFTRRFFFFYTWSSPRPFCQRYPFFS
jgi:hypothetical protein